MSKYQPLQILLARQQGTQVPMSFSEIEKALGFKLPHSARSHQAWWSNNGQNNVAVKVWRNAGWKTSRVDLSSEKVTFVREPSGGHLSALEASLDARIEAAPTIEVPVDALSASALKMVQEEAGEGGDLGAAITELLQELVIARRKALIDWFTSQSIGMTSDSVDLIREERDAR